MWRDAPVFERQAAFACHCCSGYLGLGSLLHAVGCVRHVNHSFSLAAISCAPHCVQEVSVFFAALPFALFGILVFAWVPSFHRQPLAQNAIRTL